MNKLPIERNTRQKRAIRAVFEHAKRPLTTDEVHAAAAYESRGIGIATVYRSIRALLDDGYLSPIEVPGKRVFYEVAGKSHHHHFSCTQCSRVFELEGCSRSFHVALPRGFQAAGHDLTIFGLCASCSKRPITKKA